MNIIASNEEYKLNETFTPPLGLYKGLSESHQYHTCKSIFSSTCEYNYKFHIQINLF